jgi:cytochrome c peroxidase
MTWRPPNLSRIWATRPHDMTLYDVSIVGPATKGRFAVSKNPRDRAGFKTPTRQEIARTAPYMHDGSVATLEDASSAIARSLSRR